MKINKSIALCAVVPALAFAETPDKFVRYVESTGSQYVDTGVTGRWNTKVEAQVEWMELGDMTVLGSGDWTDNTRCFMIYCNNADGNIATALGRSPTDYGRAAWRYDNANWTPWWQVNRIYDYSADFSATNAAGECVRKVAIDGIAFTNMTAAAVDSGCTMYLFGLNRKGNLASQSKARIYRLKIWQGPEDGGDMTLRRDLFPCVKDGNAGLWDAVTGDILYSETSTPLVSADENSEVPDELVEYVESTGVNFIDTEVAARSGTEAEIDLEILNRRSLDKGILEAYNGSLGNNNARYYLAHSYQGTVTCGYGLHKTTGANYTVGQRYYITSSLATGAQTLTMAAHGSATTNTIHSAADATAIDTGLPLYLFACNKDGNIDYGGQYRLYGLKIRQDGALVRDFKPCLKDGEFALYDDVSKRIFHAKRGLLNGPLQATPVKAKNLIFVDYIESSGNETLDTGVRARAGTRARGEFCWTEDFGNLAKRYEIGRYLKEPINKHQRTYLGADDPTYWPTFFNMVHAEDQRFAGYYGNGLGDSSVAYFAWAKDDSADVYAKTPLEKHSFDASFMDGEQNIELDGTQVWALSNDRNYDTGRNLHVFSTGSRYRSAARCYGLEIWQDGVKVRDFKPCIYEGKALLYDAVSKRVFRPSPDIPASKTGGVILTGDEKPDCYVDYVESDGTIFVDTGVKGRSGTKADVKMRFLEKGDWGFLDSRSGNTRFYMWHNYTKHNIFGFGYGQFQSYGSSGDGKTDADYDVKVTLAQNRQEITVNGVSKWTTGQDTTYINPSDNINTGYNLYLFAMNQDGSPTYAGKARLYYLKLYQGDSDGSNMKLVRNLKPVRLSNDVVVLWDFVEKKAYRPQLVSSPGTYTTFTSVGADGEAIRDGLVIILR